MSTITLDDPSTPGNAVTLHPYAHTKSQYFFQDDQGAIWSAQNAKGAHVKARRWESTEAFDRYVRHEKRSSSMFNDLESDR